jgi:hypothetical protein
MLKRAAEAYKAKYKKTGGTGLQELLQAVREDADKREEDRSADGTDPIERNTFARPTPHEHDALGTLRIEQTDPYETPAMPLPDSW